MTWQAIARRIGQAVVVLWATFTVSYLLLAALPGDAIIARYDDPALGLNAEQLDAIRQSYGADEPLIARYFHTLGGFLTGDFGVSVATGTPVSTLIADALPSTLVLASLAFVVGVVVAALIAVAATFPRTRWMGDAVRAFPPVLISLPTFWIGILLIQVFSFQLGWVPVIGASSSQALILPVIALSVPVAAQLSQVFLRSIDEVLAEPFIQAVRARGASASWVLWRNVARNAMLPTLTMAGLTFGELVGGSVVTEAVFARQGIGALTVDAVTNRDTAVLLAIVVLATTAFIVINLIVDLLYPMLDPRLRTTAPEKETAGEQPASMAAVEGTVR